MFLSARVVEGRFLDSWLSGGKHKVLDPGIFPHFWSLYHRKGSIPLPRRLLSNIEKVLTLFRVDVHTTRVISRMRDAESLEADIPFIQLLTILSGFTHPPGLEPEHGAWDIEMITAGQFPNFKRVPITELSWWSAPPSRKGRQEVLQGDECSILEGFNDICKVEDVDIYDTYAGGRFDWRAILARAAVNGVRLESGRLRDKPYVRAYERRFGKFRGFDYTVYFNGRLSLDVWKEVKFDTVFTGKTKNRKLKTIARFMFPDEDFIEVDRARLGELTAKERADYCLSDARATFMLAEHYLNIIKFLARELKAPLDLIIRRTPSHIGNYIYGKEFKKLDVVSDGPNFERFRGVLWE